MEEFYVYSSMGINQLWDGGKLTLYNAGLEPNSKACSLKRWVHFRWAVVLSCFFYTSLFKTICYICDFFSFSISVFLLCIGIGIILFQK